VTTHPKTIAVIDLGDFSHLRPDRFGHLPFALRCLQGQPLFMRMARRLKECKRIDQVYVVGSNLPGYVFTCGITDIKTCQLPTAHLCERLAAAVDDSQSEWVVYIPANRPFVDPSLIDQLLAHATNLTSCDYANFASQTKDPYRVNDLGLAGEVFHADTLRRLRRNVDHLPSHTDSCVVNWLREAPGAYHLKFVPLPADLDRDDLRFCMLDESDWDDAMHLCDSMGPEQSGWQGLTQNVSVNEPMRSGMMQRNASAVNATP
jgi:spore coat polysaccharide biosynthesis protein SpsF (cytidylyltransferase family)